MSTHANITHSDNLEDESSGEAFEVFQFLKVGGRPGKLIMERELADDPKQVRLRLMKHNAALSSDYDESMREVTAAIKAAPLHLLRYAASNGWLPDNTAFVNSSGIIDSKNRQQKILPPRWLNTAQCRGGKPEGHVAGWIKNVAGPCRCSDLAMTALSAAFAAPLLKMTDRHSFGLNIYGASKTGKSTILLAASSVAGVGREGELSNWAATSAAVGENCRIYCDRLMPINELGLIAKKSAYAKIQPTIYQISEGRERERHSKSVFAITDDSMGSRTIFCSTGEHSIDHYAQLAGETRDEGELARCTEIPAVRNNHKTVIDRWPKTVPSDQRNGWARRLLKRLRKACQRHHNVALKPFVEFLMKDWERAERLVTIYMQKFMDGLDTESMSGAIEHAAENFSLILAGGVLAIDAGLLPYEKGDLLRAVTRCFLSAISVTAEERDPLASGKAILVKRLKGDRIFRRSSSNGSFDAGQFDGYVVRDGERLKYVIRASSFREWFKTELGAHKEIIWWLEQKRCLLARQSRSTEIAGRPTDWAERTFAWPGKQSTPTRSIVFYTPFVK
jgi:putative DNA primase/helicase